MIIFDIETEPLPDEELRGLMPPFDDSEFVVTEFDPGSVKLGNIKDPAKAQAKVEEERAKHAARMANLDRDRQAAADAHWQQFKADAALSAVTGRVLVVSYYNPQKDAHAIHHGPEANLLEAFWTKYRSCVTDRRSMVGLNIFQFDLPFMVQRSWIIGVDVPDSVYAWWKHRHQWSETFLDVRLIWQLGVYNAKSSFDLIGKAFGTGGKNGHSGADFARMWQEDRQAAIEYAVNDVKQPAAWLRRMGYLTT